MDSREKILSRIRSQKGRDVLSKSEQDILARRIQAHKRNLVPKRSQIPPEDQIALFTEKMTELLTTVERVESSSQIPERIKAYLAAKNLPSRIKVSPSPLVANLPWEEVPTLEIVTGAGAEEDEVGLSPAFSAIAESGTLMMVSGPDTPSTVNFLPENHIVVVDVKTMCGSYEEAWDLLRSGRGTDDMPRTVNLISGPSRTADIEQRLIMGAHGPKSLHVILVG